MSPQQSQWNIRRDWRRRDQMVSLQYDIHGNEIQKERVKTAQIEKFYETSFQPRQIQKSPLRLTKTDIFHLNRN